MFNAAGKSPLGGKSFLISRLHDIKDARLSRTEPADGMRSKVGRSLPLRDPFARRCCALPRIATMARK
jgi:hypothetical protein